MTFKVQKILYFLNVITIMNKKILPIIVKGKIPSELTRASLHYDVTETPRNCVVN